MERLTSYIELFVIRRRRTSAISNYFLNEAGLKTRKQTPISRVLWKQVDELDRYQHLNR
jgi:hypothetical protein